MAFEKKLNVLADMPSFGSILDTSFERCRETHAQYSIRRLGEMEEELARLEKELDEIISR